MKCLLIDDEQASLDLLIGYIARFDNLELAGTTSSPVEGLTMVRERSVDLVFLDIQMDEMTGLELRSMFPPNVKVIFCTAYSEFAVKSYELDVTDYLLKPISFPRFAKAVNRAMENSSTIMQEDSTSEYFYVKTETKGKVLKIDCSAIDYIQSKGNYASIVQDKRVIMACLSLRELQEKLSSRQFLRVHKSYIVAINRITACEGGILRLKNVKDPIPIGDTYKPSVMENIRGRLIS